MKISPMSPNGVTVGAMSTGAEAPQSMVQKIRALKMNTNATPGRTEEAPPDPALTIPDTNIEQKSVAAEETQPLSPQYAALAKQRRALQVKERELADREKALTQTPAGSGGVDLAKLKSDPLGVMLEAGVTYEYLTEQILANQNGYNPEIRELKDKIAALESGFDKKLVDKETQAEQAALSEMRREAAQLVSQGDDFELVRETKNIPTVMELIEKTYRETGEVLDVREALGLVENELIEESLKLANLKKIQSRFAPAPALPQPQQQQRQMRTLTNRDTAAVPLSRKARALAAFQGTLKK